MMVPDPPEPTLAEVWAALNRRLHLEPWRGPEDVAEGPLLHKLAGQGVGCLADSKNPLGGAYCHSYTWDTRGRIKVSCNMTVGPDKFDWVIGVGPNAKEAFVRAALKALQWVDKRPPPAAPEEPGV